VSVGGAVNLDRHLNFLPHDSRVNERATFT